MNRIISTSLLTLGLTTSISANANGLEHPSRTATPLSFEVKNSFISHYFAKGPRDYIVRLDTCQSIIEDYYDAVEECHRDYECQAEPSFPSNTQSVLKVYDKSKWADDDDIYAGYKIARTAKTQCIFEKRKGARYYPRNRTEKGWTKIDIVASGSRNNNKGQLIERRYATAVTAALSSPDSNTGIWMCGSDGVTGYKGNIPVNGQLATSTPVVKGANRFKDLMQYQIGGEYLNRPFDLWNKNKNNGFKSILMQGFIGKIHPSSSMLAGDCNSSCTDPAWEVYALNNSETKKISLTPGASGSHKWAVHKYNDFTKKRAFFLPGKIEFTQEVKKPPGSEYDFLPGGAFFGYNSNSIFVR